ncbi:hypothetical protein FA95DRAFT_1553186 [Auriscalpium vulgare]|uniref:Uncharacterized protein n=1 Tax=Auriscalpium vulgare TaxID=40419 RepID=A0ACB8S9S7_9AGAM|nr:hypothetical protein FA95DRAFT_1553186 [Auriscalpium vulgare]
MGRLNDAEDQLNKALDVRSKIGPPFDAAVTRENLAQLYEMRGNIEASKEMRMRGSPDQIACGHYQCPATQPFNIKQIRRCGGCKSAMYCSKGCQTSDWKRHKKFCRNPTA